MDDRSLNMLCSLLNRGNEYCVIGETLFEVVRKLPLSRRINVMVFDEVVSGRIVKRAAGFGLYPKIESRGKIVLSGKLPFEIEINIGTRDCKYVADDETIGLVKSLSNTGTWRVPILGMEQYTFELPYRLGAVLDENPGWFKDQRSGWDHSGGFMDKKRKANAVELIRSMLECGERAGILHAMFLAFGVTLGYVREADFIPNDNDLDMCIFADRITKEQGDRYFEECNKAGLFENRLRGPARRDDDGKILWFSLGPKSITAEHGIKSCNWFWFEHGKYLWHSKGNLWVNARKFNQQKISYTSADRALAKGIPARYFDKMTEIDFHGIKIQAPAMAGTCCDWWYPGWCHRHGGSSAHQMILVVPDWKNKKSWHMG